MDEWVDERMNGWMNGWVDDWMKARTFDFMEYTKRRNLNRGYMRLEAWQRGLDLFALAFELSENIGDFKLKSQFRDAAQSVAANVAEGYGRRSLPEYIQFLYIAKGSLGEALTRALGLQNTRLISKPEFESFDELHYEVENKLLRLIESLELKRDANDWNDRIPYIPHSQISRNSPVSPSRAIRTASAATTNPEIH